MPFAPASADHLGDSPDCAATFIATQAEAPQKVQVNATANENGGLVSQPHLYHRFSLTNPRLFYLDIAFSTLWRVVTVAADRSEGLARC